MTKYWLRVFVYVTFSAGWVCFAEAMALIVIAGKLISSYIDWIKLLLGKWMF